MTSNPFKPTAGKMPPVLIGRHAVIETFTEGLDNGAGAPGRLMLLLGQRGYGKTVLLTELRRVAESRGWVTVAETASEGLTARLIGAIQPQGPVIDGATISPSVGVAGVASVSLGQVGISPSTAPLTLRNAIEQRLASRKVQKGKGILITVDEAQAASREDLVAIATAVQHIITSQDQTDLPDNEKKGIALVFAGLPSVASDLLNDKVLTFLRRAVRQNLGSVPLPDVRNAYIESIRESGKSMTDEVAEKAAALTDGYPYMVQLVGYYMWQSAQRDGRMDVNERDVAKAEADAVAAFGEAVCAPALGSLTPTAREFAHLVARMGPGAIRMMDLEKASGKGRSWLNKYRAVLCEKQIARIPERGTVELSIPHLREYLNKH